MGQVSPEELIKFIARNYYSAPDRKSVKMLEVGSGTGANIWYLSREGFDATGIDGSSVGVERAKERLKKESLPARVVVGDIVTLPFADSTFDCVQGMDRRLFEDITVFG